MRILATGGAGYVGSHFVKLALEQGHEVLVYDNLTAGHRQAVPPDTRLIRADLLDRTLLRQTFDEYSFDVAIHFAGLLNVNESVAQPQRYYDNNVLASMNLIGELIRCQVRGLVFSSSCAVYGVPTELPITEDLPKEPVTPYGRTKWTVEMALQDGAAAGSLASVSLRYFNASGAALDGSLGEDRDPEYHLIPVVLQVALEQRQEIQVFGTDYPTPDGTAVRDYVHVEDLAAAHLLALEQLQPGAALAYNVGTGRGSSVREVLETARRVTAHAIPTVEGPRREGDPPELYADPARIEQDLGWRPKHADLEEIVRSAWDWHSSHPHGYED